MREVSEGEPAVSGIDLKGIPESLQDWLLGLEDEGVRERFAEACRRVAPNHDGGVIVRLETSIKVKRDPECDRIELRGIKGRDYVDETASKLIDDPTYEGGLRFAAKLSKYPGDVEEIVDLRDIDAAFCAVVHLRKNWYRPKT